MFTTVTWKIICSRCIAPPILFQDGLKYSPCSTEWIDVHHKRICGNILTVRGRSFMMNSMLHHIMAPRGDGNSLHSKTDNKACPLYYMFASIEYKGIYL